MGDRPDAKPLSTHRTTQTQKNADAHPCLEWDSKTRSQCSSGRRQYVPQLGPALRDSFGTVCIVNLFECATIYTSSSPFPSVIHPLLKIRTRYLPYRYHYAVRLYKIAWSFTSTSLRTISPYKYACPMESFCLQCLASDGILESVNVFVYVVV
jgi:hypothetical protein